MYGHPQLVGYNTEKIVGILVAQCPRCEHNVSLLAPCEMCGRVDALNTDAPPPNLEVEWGEEPDG